MVNAEYFICCCVWQCFFLSLSKNPSLASIFFFLLVVVSLLFCCVICSSSKRPSLDTVRQQTRRQGDVWLTPTTACVKAFFTGWKLISAAVDFWKVQLVNQWDIFSVCGWGTREGQGQPHTAGHPGGNVLDWKSALPVLMNGTGHLSIILHAQFCNIISRTVLFLSARLTGTTNRNRKEPRRADFCRSLFFQSIPGASHACILRWTFSLAGDLGLLWSTVGVCECVCCSRECSTRIPFLYPQRFHTVIRVRVFL